MRYAWVAVAAGVVVGAVGVGVGVYLATHDDPTYTTNESGLACGGDGSMYSTVVDSGVNTGAPTSLEDSVTWALGYFIPAYDFEQDDLDDEGRIVIERHAEGVHTFIIQDGRPQAVVDSVQGLNGSWTSHNFTACSSFTRRPAEPR